MLPPVSRNTARDSAIAPPRRACASLRFDCGLRPSLRMTHLGFAQMRAERRHVALTKNIIPRRGDLWSPVITKNPPRTERVQNPHFSPPSPTVLNIFRYLIIKNVLMICAISREEQAPPLRRCMLFLHCATKASISVILAILRRAFTERPYG